MSNDLVYIINDGKEIEEISWADPRYGREKLYKTKQDAQRALDRKVTTMKMKKKQKAEEARRLAADFRRLAVMHDDLADDLECATNELETLLREIEQDRSNDV